MQLGSLSGRRATCLASSPLLSIFVHFYYHFSRYSDVAGVFTAFFHPLRCDDELQLTEMLMFLRC